MRTSRLIAIAGLLVGLSSQASAATILDTTNSQSMLLPPVFGVGNGQIIESSPAPGQSIGIPFTLSSAGTIQSVTAYIAEFVGLSSVEIGIMNNSVNVPNGSFISGDTFTVAAPNPAVPINQTGLNWSLAAATYWLVAVGAPGALEWQTLNGVSGNYAKGNGTGTGGWTSAGGLEPMALIQGTGTVVSPVPLPATLPLFATGLGALGLLGWRRKRKAASA